MTVRTRANFAVHHLLAAARFARLSHEVEATHAGEPFGPFFDEIIAYVSATILSSGAALEAYINEIFIEADTNFPEYQQKQSAILWNMVWEALERNTTVEKYDRALALKNQAPFKGDKTPAIAEIARAIRTLIDVRNALIHFKPQWGDEAKSHREITRALLAEQVAPSPFIPGAPVFPTGFMSHATAAWTVMTVLRFVAAFSQRAGLDNRFAKHIDRFNPGLKGWPPALP